MSVCRSRWGVKRWHYLLKRNVCLFISIVEFRTTNCTFCTTVLHWEILFKLEHEKRQFGVVSDDVDCNVPPCSCTCRVVLVLSSHRLKSPTAGHFFSARETCWLGPTHSPGDDPFSLISYPCSRVPKGDRHINRVVSFVQHCLYRREKPHKHGDLKGNQHKTTRKKYLVQQQREDNIKSEVGDLFDIPSIFALYQVKDLESIPSGVAQKRPPTVQGGYLHVPLNLLACARVLLADYMRGWKEFSVMDEVQWKCVAFLICYL